MENTEEKEDVGDFYTKTGVNELFIDVFAIKYGLWKISIYDNLGKLLSSEAKFLTKGKNTLPIFSNFNSPLLVKFESGSFSHQRIFTIE